MANLTLTVIEGSGPRPTRSGRVPYAAALAQSNGRGGGVRAAARRVSYSCCERNEDGTLCSLLATTCDVDKGYPVCALHAIGPAEREWLAGLLTGWADQFLGRRRARG